MRVTHVKDFQMYRFNIRLYPMVAVGAALVAGILLGDALYGDVALRLLPLLLAGLLVVAWLTMRMRRAGMVALMLAVVVSGMLRMAVELRSGEVALPRCEVEYDAVVASEPVVHGRVVRMDLLMLGPGGAVPVSASLLRDTVEHRYERLHVGSGLHAYSMLERDRTGRGVSTFVYYSHWHPAVVSLGSLTLLQRARMRLMAFRSNLVGVFDDQAVARAMVLGDKSGLSRELRRSYSVSGVSHLLALSGLHLGIIYALLSVVAFRFRRHWLGQSLVLLAVWGYVVLVGMMPSVVRSACMLTVYTLATVLGRSRISVNSWALAAVVMLLASPLSLWDVGFQMSFLAVLAILVIVPPIVRHPLLAPIRGYRVGRWLVDMLAVSLAAQLGTAPLIAHVFGRFATYGLLVNLVAVPLAMLVVWVGVACLCFSWSPLLLSVLQPVLSRLGSWLSGVASCAASLPGASVEVNLSAWQTVACYVLLSSVLMLADFAGIKKYTTFAGKSV